MAPHSAPPLWRSAMGEEAWARLGPAVRRAHDWPDDARVTAKSFRGRVMVTGGAGAVGWLMRRVLGFPEATGVTTLVFASDSDTPRPHTLPIEVRMRRCPVSGEEVWHRLFGGGEGGETGPPAGQAGHAVTRQSLGDSATDAGLVCEKPLMGAPGGVFARLPAAVILQPASAPSPAKDGADALVMEACKQTVLGIPLPSFLQPRVLGREWEGPIPKEFGEEFEAKRQAGARVFHFDVSICLPFLGEAAGYRGFLFNGEFCDEADPWGTARRERARQQRKAVAAEDCAGLAPTAVSDPHGQACSAAEHDRSVVRSRRV